MTVDILGLVLGRGGTLSERNSHLTPPTSFNRDFRNGRDVRQPKHVYTKRLIESQLFNEE